MICPTCGGDAQVMVTRPYCSQRCQPPEVKSGLSPEVAPLLRRPTWKELFGDQKPAATTGE